MAHLSLDALPADVQRELQYTPSPTAGASASGTDALIAPRRDAEGQAGRHATGQAWSRRRRPAIKYYAIYYSASWCPPCHAFTPKLVDWYRTFKPNHHDFELIFVSEDMNASAMAGYMTEMVMPWPGVKYEELPRSNGTFRGPGIQQFAAGGLPVLVLVDASGKVLADSFNGATYLGPESVIDYMNNHL